MHALAVEIAAGHGLRLADVSSRIPSSRRGKQVHPATVFKWATEGVSVPGGRRIKLETLPTACGLMTSESALARFLAEVAEAKQHEPV